MAKLNVIIINQSLYFVCFMTLLKQNAIYQSIETKALGKAHVPLGPTKFEPMMKFHQNWIIILIKTNY